MAVSAGFFKIVRIDGRPRIAHRQHVVRCMTIRACGSRNEAEISRLSVESITIGFVTGLVTTSTLFGSLNAIRANSGIRNRVRIMAARADRTFGVSLPQLPVRARLPRLKNTLVARPAKPRDVLVSDPGMWIIPGINRVRAVASTTRRCHAGKPRSRDAPSMITLQIALYDRSVMALGARVRLSRRPHRRSRIRNIHDAMWIAVAIHAQYALL